MKKVLLAPLFAAAAFFCFLFLSGCLKDKCSKTYKYYAPVYKTLSQVREGMKSSTSQPLETTGKLYLFGKYIFLNEVNKGIHVIDNSNPAAPKNISFIPIPGNVDLAVKGSSLYADSYSDLVVFDISTPTNVIAKKFVNNTFPDRNRYYSGNSTNPDLVKVVVGYNERDTTVDCETYSRQYAYDSFSGCANCMQSNTGSTATAAAAPQIGQGGSMARFTIVNDYLYTVSTTQLRSFNITTAADPQLFTTKNVGQSIETIYPFNNRLFIGSASGMFIYDVANPGNPALLGQFSHVRSCDPVIADDKYAYVTLRSGTQCQGFTNQLEVLDITNLTRPSMVKIYPMTNPHGLSKDGNLLFICDGRDGLKLYNAANPNNVQLLKTITGITTYDVITANGIALVVASDGLHQFDYSDTNNIKEISRIGLAKK